VDNYTITPGSCPLMQTQLQGMIFPYIIITIHTRNVH